jgi:Ran GTPase-activating protein (RanGAP) involved in mRNA processing and transport
LEKKLDWTHPGTPKDIANVVLKTEVATDDSKGSPVGQKSINFQRGSSFVTQAVAAISPVDGVELNVNASVKTEGGAITLILPEYDPRKFDNGKLVLNVMLAISDHEFRAEVNSPNNNSVKASEPKSHLSMFSSRCEENYHLQRYSGCGGKRLSEIFAITLDAWDPDENHKVEIHTELKGFENFTQDLLIRTVDDEEPLEWVVKSECKIPDNLKADTKLRHKYVTRKVIGDLGRYCIAPDKPEGPVEEVGRYLGAFIRHANSAYVLSSLGRSEHFAYALQEIRQRNNLPAVHDLANLQQIMEFDPSELLMTKLCKEVSYEDLVIMLEALYTTRNRNHKKQEGYDKEARKLRMCVVERGVMETMRKSLACRCSPCVGFILDEVLGDEARGEDIYKEVFESASEFKLTPADSCTGALDRNAGGTDGLCSALTVFPNVHSITLDSFYSPTHGFQEFDATRAKRLSAVIATNRHLEELSLRDFVLDNDTIEPMAPELKKLKDLRVLDLSNNKLGQRTAVSTLANALSELQNLESLLLAGNNLTLDAIVPLGQILSTLTQLKTLDLSSADIGPEKMQDLSPHFQSLTNLEGLLLGGNSIQATGANALANILSRFASLRKLNLAGNNMNEGAIGILNVVEGLGELESIDLSANDLQLGGAKVLARIAPKLSNVIALALDENDFGEDSAELVAQALSNMTKLKRLSLSTNGFGTKGAETIIKVLPKLVHLEELHLDSDGFGNKSLNLPAALLGATKLNKLSLLYSDLNAGEKKRLRSSLESELPALKFLAIDS